MVKPNRIDMGLSQVEVFFDDNEEAYPYRFTMKTEDARRVHSLVDKSLGKNELVDIQSWDVDNDFNDKLYFNPNKIVAMKIIHGTRIDPPESEK